VPDRESSLAGLAGSYFRLLGNTLPTLLGLTSLFVIPTFLMMSLPLGWLVAPCISHAIFLMAASRVITRQINPDLVRRPLPLRRWIAGIAFLSVGGFLVSYTYTSIIPYPSNHSVIVVLAALVAWTPLLPILALEPDAPLTALRTIGRQLSRFIMQAALLSLPLLAFAQWLGRPAQTCTGECWGLFEGGALMFPLLGAHMFVAAVTAALVPTIIYVSRYQRASLPES
jgi:hypothetical protein